MNILATPFSFVISLLLLMLGVLGFTEAQGKCAGVCVFDDQFAAASTGLAMFIVGLFNLVMCIRASGTDAVAKATGPAQPANVYDEVRMSTALDKHGLRLKPGLPQAPSALPNQATRKQPR